MKYFQIIILFIIQNILAQYVEDGRKINLDDIEHDNLLSEKLAHENEPLITQSTQHLRPPSILAVNPYLTHQSSGGIIYTTPHNEGEIHYAQPVHDDQKFHHHHHHNHPHQIQYLTQQQSPELLAEQNYNQQVYGTPAAVHEHDPTYTYTTIASRQSLLKPIIPTIATYLSQQQHQQQQPEQPQYVYLPHGRSLHHRPQAIQQVVGGIQYVTHQPPSPVIYTHEDQEIGNEQKVADDQIIYHHHHPQPQQIPGSGPTYLQYVPYVTRGSNNGQYIIMAPIPAGYGQPTSITKPILSYSHSETPQQLVQYVPQQASNPIVGGIQYVTSNEIENVPESVQPHPHPVQRPYRPDYTNVFSKRPSKLYRIENSDQSNTDYTNSYSDQRENVQENSHSNYVEEEKQSETTKLNPQIRQDENNEEDLVPRKQVIPYTPQIQDIQYATPDSISDEQNSDQEKSKQQQYAPEHPEKEQLRTSKPAQNNQYFTPNRFSSFQSTTENPTSQRYYAAQKHFTDTTKPNEQQQQYLQQQQQQHEHPTSSTQSWSNKVMPMQYQQYEPRYSTPTAISSTNSFAIKQGPSTPNPNKIQSNTITAFRSPIPKYYLPTPKLIQSTHRPTTSTFSITTNEQKHFTAKHQQAQSQPQQNQQKHQNFQINATPTPPIPKFIQTVQQHQEPINNNQANTFANSKTFTITNRQPKSLLESYIPSWVVVENQNKANGYEHQIENSNNYNTLSYSVPHNQVNGNHLKRSPQPTTVTTTKLMKI